MKAKKSKKEESQGFLKRFLRHKMATVGFIVLGLMTFAVLFLPPILGLDPYTTGQGLSLIHISGVEYPPAL